MPHPTSNERRQLAPLVGGAMFAEPQPAERAGGTQELDKAIAELKAAKDDWARRTTLDERIAVADEILVDLGRVAGEWVQRSCEAKGIDLHGLRAGEEWGGVVVVARQTRFLAESLRDIREQGRPRIPGPLTRGPNDELIVRAFPRGVYDKLLFAGQTGDVWLEPGTTREQLLEEQAAPYREEQRDGKVALVLAAGNFSSLGPLDLLHKVFNELRVVLMKTNPVNKYLKPVWEKAFRALIERDLLRIVDGGAAEGAYLAEHPDIDELHLTGSDKTYEAIVFGPGADGQKRKAEHRPKNTRRFTCELGNIAPWIVVPGPWSDKEIAYQAEHIASTVTFNAGFNCLSARLVIQHDGWDQRDALLDQIRRILTETPLRKAYYPGASAIHSRFVQAHPEADLLGEAVEGCLPWTLVSGVDATDASDISFRSEPFCNLFSETRIAAASVPEFIERAVALANERLWGSLTATFLVHPRSLEDPAIARALDRAVAEMRYGTVGVNMWGSYCYALGTTWGAFPGHPPHDIQSGHGTIINPLMLPRVQKTVLRGPFVLWPKPPLFVSSRTAHKVYEKLAFHDLAPSPLNIPGMLWSAMRA